MDQRPQILFCQPTFTSVPLVKFVDQLLLGLASGIDSRVTIEGLDDIVQGQALLDLFVLSVIEFNIVLVGDLILWCQANEHVVGSVAVFSMHSFLANNLDEEISGACCQTLLQPANKSLGIDEKNVQITNVSWICRKARTNLILGELDLVQHQFQLSYVTPKSFPVL